MTQIDYTEKRANIIARLHNAISHLCPLTAKARCRDLARLKSEYDGSPYKANLIEIEAEYGIISMEELDSK